MTQVISHKDLLSWLNQLLQEYTVIAPTSVGELILFKPVTRGEEIIMNFGSSTLSPKEWFFPPTETLLTMISKNGGSQLVPATAMPKAVLFGLHPCDAKGITLIDKPFLAEPTDTLYKEKRDKTTLVGLACTSACPECFCTSLGSGPHDPTHLDILLTPVKEGFAIQVTTDKGKALLPQASITELAVTLPPPPDVNPVPTKDITQIMRQSFNHLYWSRVADRCIHCNICAYVCPVCYCFDIRDYVSKGNIERVRTWESCQSPGFTRIAGGYDPRPSKGAHLRQRWYHKLLYFPELFGDIKCTGCGRCVRSCPVNIDIREIITDIHKLGA